MARPSPRALCAVLAAVAAAAVGPARAGDGGEGETGEASGGEGDGDEGAVRAAEETVDVVGARPDLAPDPSSTSAAVTVIEVDDRLPAASDAAGVIGDAAGVHVQRLGGLADTAVITVRGSSARQVEVFVDGVPLNAYGGTAIDLTELPLGDFERVEVYRSGTPPELGSAAMGGAVNLVTAPGRPPAPRLDLTAGSYGTRRLAATGGWAGRGAGRTVDLLLAGEGLSSRGDFSFFDDRGTVYDADDDRVLTRINNDVAQAEVRARVRVAGGAWRLTLSDALLLRDQGLPGLGHDQATEARFGAFQNGLVLQARASSSHAVAVRARASYRLRAERYQDPLGEIGTGVQDSRDRFHGGAAMVHVGWVPAPWQALGATVELRLDGYEPVDRTREVATDGARARAGLVLSLADDLSLLGDRLRLSPVAQLHVLDNRALGRVPFGDAAVAPDAAATRAAFTPRLGLLLRPLPALAVKANVWRAFRPPDFIELFGDHGTVIGNTDLRPETAVAWDAGARLAGGPPEVVAGSLSATVFWRRSDDAIVYVQNSQSTQVPVNFGRARVWGIEAAADATVARAVDLRAALTWTDSVNLDEAEAYRGNQLPGVPTWEVEGRASVRILDVARLGGSYGYTAGTYLDATNWYLTAPRNLVGAFARVQPGPRWPSLEIEVRNLLDITTQEVPRDPLNPDDGETVVKPLTDFAGYPLPGRTILVTIGYREGAAP